MVILNPFFSSFLIVWYSASYRVCVISTLFPLLLTFLTQHSLFQGTHFVLLMPQFLFVTFLHRFGSRLAFRDLVHLPVRQDHAFCTFEPMSKHCYKKLDIFQLCLYTISYWLNRL